MLRDFGLPRLGIIHHDQHALILPVQHALLQRFPGLLAARFLVAVIAVEKARSPAPLAQRGRRLDQEPRFAEPSRPVDRGGPQPAARSQGTRRGIPLWSR